LEDFQQSGGAIAIDEHAIATRKETRFYHDN
jgi:hypothetical protein